MIHQLGGKGSTAVLPSTQPDTFPEAFRKGRWRRRDGKGKEEEEQEEEEGEEKEEKEGKVRIR